MTATCIVLTVNYCCADTILQHLDQTMQEVLAAGADYWIIDNASPDGSGARLQEVLAQKPYADRLRVILSDRNGGFGAGNNIGLRAALELAEPPEYVYLLNPDATPLPGALQHMLAFMRATPQAGVVGGLLVNQDGATEASFFRFPSFLSEIERAISFGPLHRLLKNHVLPLPTPQQPEAVGWISGASFLVRLQTIENAGFFDETFFLYWEEIEWCHRIRATGVRIYALPEAKVMHIGSVSTGVDPDTRALPAYWYASRNHLFRTTGLAGNVTLLNLCVAMGLLLRRLHQIMRGRALLPPRHLRDFLRYSFRPPPRA